LAKVITRSNYSTCAMYIFLCPVFRHLPRLLPHHHHLVVKLPVVRQKCRIPKFKKKPRIRKWERVCEYRHIFLLPKKLQ